MLKLKCTLFEFEIGWKFVHIILLRQLENALNKQSSGYKVRLTGTRHEMFVNASDFHRLLSLWNSSFELWIVYFKAMTSRNCAILMYVCTRILVQSVLWLLVYFIYENSKQLQALTMQFHEYVIRTKCKGKS